MKQDRRLLLFGEILWDMVPSGAQPGGATANVAVMAESCGTRTLLVSALGNDALGQEMLAQLRQNDVPTDGIHISSQLPTSTVDITLTADGQPSYIIHNNVAWDAIPVDEPLLLAARSAKAFYFGSLVQRSPVSHQSLQQLLSALPEDCLRFFDINLRKPLPDPQVIRFSLENIDVLKLNNDELPVLARWLDMPAEERNFANAIFKQFPISTILLTKGEHGAEVFERSSPGPSHIAPLKVESLVNTIGAGDAFSAGFISAILNRNATPVQAATFGNSLAAKVCQHDGAWLRNASLIS